MKKKTKKEDSEMVAFSIRLPEYLYNTIKERSVNNKRSLSKETEFILENALV